MPAGESLTMGLFGRDTQTEKPQTAPTQRETLQPTVSGLTTSVAEGTKISGKITGTTDIRIDGEFEGSVSISGTIFVGGSGRVQAEIRASTVTVAGRVDGDIFGDQIIELEPSAVVNGNLLGPKILIREGASLQGRVEMASPVPEAATSESSQETEKAGKGRAQKHGRTHKRSHSAERSGGTKKGDTNGNC